jgi:hypothetical protein
MKKKVKEKSQRKKTVYLNITRPTKVLIKLKPKISKDKIKI